MEEVHIRWEAWGTRRVEGILSTAVVVVDHILIAEVEARSHTEVERGQKEVGRSRQIVEVEGRSSAAAVEVHIRAVGLGQGNMT
jgi:hypothetical protein